MKTLDRLCALLPEEDARRIRALGDDLCEVRLRAGRPVQLRAKGGAFDMGGALACGEVAAIAASLMDHSLYAREAELAQGFFTMEDGCRVGACGRMVWDGGRIAGMAAIGSLCVRVCREIRGCADRLLEHMLDESGRAVRATLLLSGPGMGKTTCLREAARCLSERRLCVAVADERHELAACRDGVPTLDVGPCTDVMDGGPKHLAIRHLLRAAAPEVIVTDEIGAREDAAALAEAVRCGVPVLASAHARDLGAALDRAVLGDVLRSGAFERIVVLGGAPGCIQSVHLWPEDVA